MILIKIWLFTKQQEQAIDLNYKAKNSHQNMLFVE
jgi:hypothetical protein